MAITIAKAATVAPKDGSLAFPQGRSVMRIEEAAKRLGCSNQHVADLIEEGQIAALDVSGAGNSSGRKTWRIYREGWEAFLARRFSG